MGTVYLATDIQGEKVAVKFLSPSLAAEPELRSRFAREIRLQEELDHPAIVKVKGHGEFRDIPWFAMELVGGPTLAERLKERRLALAEIGAIFGRLLAALDYAHAKGVVHRDLKPTNVLLGTQGAKLVDFGIAHWEQGTANHTTQLTRTDTILGTFPYMSPEQKAGKTVDARSDLYSIGVMLYEAFTGERPEGAFAPIRDLHPDVPSPIDPLVRHLLKPNPQERLGSAREARQRLEHALTSRRWSPRAVWVSAGVGLVALYAVAALYARPPSQSGAAPGATVPSPTSPSVTPRPSSPADRADVAPPPSPPQTTLGKDIPVASSIASSNPASSSLRPRTSSKRQVSHRANTEDSKEQPAFLEPSQSLIQSDSPGVATKKENKQPLRAQENQEPSSDFKPSGKTQSNFELPALDELPVQQDNTSADSPAKKSRPPPAK